MNNYEKCFKSYDVVVVGGGMSGVCAAISSARHGAKTAIVQNRPVFGGNASSEIRMHICGADHHGTRPDARETGILEEILLEHKKRNPNSSFSIFDTVLWEKVRFQENLDMYLNTHMEEVICENNSIKKIIATQLTTERVFEVEGKLFIDATGDGTLGYLAGAEYMFGREGKNVFGEKYAPDDSDNITMGNTLLFRAIDTGKPIVFEKPFWANTYKEEELAYRNHDVFTSGYWWIELGGDELEVIKDGELLRDELLKAVYGVWDHIKNSGHHNSENFDLEWIGLLPGKRESRRLTGDYILKEYDCFSGKIFDDAIAYGGWPMDMHIVGGLKTKLEPTLFLNLDEMYTIPYRSLYSKNINNLLLAGRAISTSHMAFGSTRVMATCAVVGQASGTAAAIAIKKDIMPREVLTYIKELQLALMKDDCFIPYLKNSDEKDLAKNSKITCSSNIKGGEAENILNGYSRKIKDASNCWISEELNGNTQWVCVSFDKTVLVKEIDLIFDSNLSKLLMPSLSHRSLVKQSPVIPPELIKDYDLEFIKDDVVISKLTQRSNYLRHKVHKLEHELLVDKIKVTIVSTNGDKNARIFELRVY